MANITQNQSKKMRESRPPSHKIEVGKWCNQPLSEQCYPEELEALVELKKDCAEVVHYEDEFLVACLMARKLDKTRAIELIRSNWTWRKENGFEKLPTIDDLDWSLSRAQQTITGARSKGGNAILYAQAKFIEPDKLNIDTILRWAVWYYCRGQFFQGMDCCRNGVIMVQDLDGYGLRNFSMGFQKKLMVTFQNHFPIRIKKACQLNAPMIMKVIITMIKPFLSAKLMSRFAQVSSEELIDYIGKENLWDKYGGDLTSSRADFIFAINEYAEKRYGEKMTDFTLKRILGEEEYEAALAKRKEKTALNDEKGEKGQDDPKPKKSKSKKKEKSEKKEKKVVADDNYSI